MFFGGGELGTKYVFAVSVKNDEQSYRHATAKMCLFDDQKIKS